MKRLALLALVACSAPPEPPTLPVTPPVPVVEAPAFDAGIDAPVDAPIDALISAPDAAPVVVPAVATGPELWLKGNTHVHAKPSGDSTMPIPDVMAWYEQHGYDFIVLTDHNRVSEVGTTSTAGNVAVHDPEKGLIVIAGIELTNNPTGCIPPGDESGRCRIHVNLLGVTARPEGKITWAKFEEHVRVEKYQAAIDQQKQLGGLMQINHPNWYWGMTADVLAEIARRGMSLVEIANSQFETWNAGDKDHPSTEALWDAVLGQGITLWGVASDDAHHYGPAGGKYPPGGGWVVVKAQRDPRAILDALAKGRFYASNGVTLARADVENAALVVEVDRRELGAFTIEFIENGKLVATVKGKQARRALPKQGYVRAVVTRGDGKKAWVQPAKL